MTRKPKGRAGRGKTTHVGSMPTVPAGPPSIPEPRTHRRAPVPDEEIVNRLNELVEAERAGVGAAVVRCARRPRPEVLVYPPARLLVILNALAPRLADSLLLRFRRRLLGNRSSELR